MMLTESAKKALCGRLECNCRAETVNDLTSDSELMSVITMSDDKTCEAIELHWYE